MFCDKDPATEYAAIGKIVDPEKGVLGVVR
jgi:hypothetical protein